jgi:hypothetical protein
MAAETAHYLASEPRLPGHHPHVLVQIPAGAPGRIPVLARHVPDQKRGHRGQADLGMPVQKVGEPARHHLVDPVRLGHEIRPIEE